MSIKDLIQEVFDKHEYWDYYSDPFSVDNIVNPQKCKEFINRFFSVSGKAGCLVDIVNIDELKKNTQRDVNTLFMCFSWELEFITRIVKSR